MENKSKQTKKQAKAQKSSKKLLNEEAKRTVRADKMYHC